VALKVFVNLPWCLNDWLCWEGTAKEAVRTVGFQGQVLGHLAVPLCADGDT
jgi:uncharacterized membrane protein